MTWEPVKLETDAECGNYTLQAKMRRWRGIDMWSVTLWLATDAVEIRAGSNAASEADADAWILSMVEHYS
jgi:hypothetical protein